MTAHRSAVVPSCARRSLVAAALSVVASLSACKMQEPATAPPSPYPLPTPVMAYGLQLPPINPGVTPLGVLAANPLFQTGASPEIRLKVVFAVSVGGVARVVQVPFANFKTQFPDWETWLIIGYSPGFKVPLGIPPESDNYKWIAVSMVDKGGEVGVVIEPPLDQKKREGPVPGGG